MKNISYLIVVFFILVSCGNKNKVPTEIIQPEKMQNILWDVVRSQALSAEEARKDSTINEIAQTKVFVQKVFKIHNITSLDYDKSYKWYTSHPDIMKVLLDSLSSQIQEDNKLDLKEKHESPKLHESPQLNNLKKIKPE